MAFEYLSNVPLEEAVEGFIAALKERGMKPAAETVPVGESLGRVTAEPLYAAISAPHYHPWPHRSHSVRRQPRRSSCSRRTTSWWIRATRCPKDATPS